MSLNKKIILCIFLLGLLFPQNAYSQTYTSDSLSLTIYIDGNVEIEYVIDPDPTFPQVNVTLFGSRYQDLLIIDSDGIILDWGISDNNITIDSLGSNSVTIFYSTDSLTNKTGSEWSVSINSPINVLYNLPVNAVLVGVTPSPIGISIVDNHAVLTMQAGLSEISYLFGATGTREHALVVLNAAKKVVNEVLQRGIIIDEASSLLDQAITTYQSGEYSQSEQLSTQASTLARTTESAAVVAMNAINSTHSLIESRRNQIDVKTIDQAQDLLNQSESQYRQGLYSNAKIFAEEAYNIVLNAPMKQTVNPIYIIVGVTLLVIIGLWYYSFTKSNLSSSLKKPSIEPPRLNLDLFFKKNPRLRTDDKEILLFLEESRGAFITEIRKKFDMPKTSAWRMTRRLESSGLILVTKINGETYLQLKEGLKET